jgi:hypothetical protein
MLVSIYMYARGPCRIAFCKEVSEALFVASKKISMDGKDEKIKYIAPIL